MRSYILNIRHHLLLKIKKIIKSITTEEFRETFLEIYEYKNNPIKIVYFFLLLPLTFLFVIINFFTTIISIVIYFLIFIKKFILVRFFKKKEKSLRYVRRFKFLKNFYVIFFEKILISLPKKRAFLIVYLLLRNTIKKDKTIFEKDIITYYIKSISNRYAVVFLLGIPYIVIYCNNWFVISVFDLKQYKYHDKMAFIGTVCLNLYKDILPMYTKAVDKLKITIYKKKIVFNFSKELLQTLKYRREFVKAFSSIKKKTKFGMAKNITKINKSSFECKEVENKSHFTASISMKDGWSMNINETSKENLPYFKYNKEINEYVSENFKNSFLHKGTINKNLKTFYTPIIISEQKDLKFLSPTENFNILKNMREDDLNNIIAAMTLSFDKVFLEKKMLTINGINKTELIENIRLNRTIEYIKEMKEKIDNQTYESILGIDFFWKENEKIIENLDIIEKLNLAKELNLGKNIDAKEINFQIFKNFIT